MNPILLDFPNEFTTKRLLIRMPMPSDGKAVYDAISTSLPELKPWVPFAQKEQSEQDLEANVRQTHLDFLSRKDLRLHLFLKESGQFIGSSGLHRIDWTVPKFEIGYWLDTRFSGKGYMTEAGQGITDFAFNELKAKRIEIRCDPNNIKSRAIPEKLGYTLEGVLKNNAKAPDSDGLVDTCVFAKIN
ncbi:GNAT family N-acetyltransferase [Bacillus sp. AGMB 02131]|uniref:GNAT family N-acetyltransferase n=1 Tax=Peribacillus faecalis TaxID=2772559 RepID=A0A927CYK1_9BACI|nr:GNAT family N-acetyltransferase [Peribacillus faecalis]MBD3110088.1 GNAT family N-acetyltransferase [Peribacillus faecalis]